MKYGQWYYYQPKQSLDIKTQNTDRVGIVVIPTEFREKIFDFGNKFPYAEIALFGKAITFDLNENVGLAIPLILYTIPTTISSASIEYNNRDIFETGNRISVNITDEVLEFIKNVKGKNVKIAPNVSVHKHPSKSGFSGLTGDESIYLDDIGILRRFHDYRGYSIDFVYGSSYNGTDWGEVVFQEVDVRPDKHFAVGTYTYRRTIILEEKGDDILGFVIEGKTFKFTHSVGDITKYPIISKILPSIINHDIFNIDIVGQINDHDMKSTVTTPRFDESPVDLLTNEYRVLIANIHPGTEQRLRSILSNYDSIDVVILDDLPGAQETISGLSAKLKRKIKSIEYRSRNDFDEILDEVDEILV